MKLIRRLSLFAAIMLSFISFTQVEQVFGLSQAQKNIYSSGINFYDEVTGTAACGSSATTLVGAVNAEKVWNYLKSKGLDDIHAAAVWGNLRTEDGAFNPERIEGGHGLPATSPNPADAQQWGWGIAQWTPGIKILKIQSNLNVPGAINDLLTQLNIVWGEMNVTTPVGYSGFLKDFQQTTTLVDATQFFTTNFEGPSIIGARLANAQVGLSTYGGGTTPVNTGNTGSGCTATNAGSPDCKTATGVAKILCEAKKYDPVSYSETIAGGHQGAVAWHQTCPVINASCILDCSGLVNIAVYDAFSVDVRENTYAEINDIGKYWKEVTYDQLQAGDIMQPNPGHVEIVDHVVGNTIYTFASNNPNVPQPDQVSPGSEQKASGQRYLQYIGPGV